jgi:dTDP-4-amino-4,6-dideoxygalactose transaminase
MVVTEDEGLARRIGIMRLHGIDREIWNRYTSKDASWRYAVIEAGYKYNMTDLAAAVGRVQLRRAEEFLEKRTAIARRYREAFRDRDYLILPAESEGHAWHLFLLRIDESKLTISRDEYIEHLRELGIGTSVHFIPLHLQPYWRDRYGLKQDDFPEAVRKYSCVLSLPIYPGLTASQVERIIQSVLSVGDSRYRKA